MSEYIDILIDHGKDKGKVRREPLRVWGRVDRFGQSTQRVDCPFCKTTMTVYVWSFAGKGKRCPCGALLNAAGGFKSLTDAETALAEDDTASHVVDLMAAACHTMSNEEAVKHVASYVGLLPDTVRHYVKNFFDSQK